jgi:ISXO2-like transposase domain
VHTNTLEGFFSVLKRGLVGVYQHVDSKHLDRYLAEFDFDRTLAPSWASTMNSAPIWR